VAFLLLSHLLKRNPAEKAAVEDTWQIEDSWPKRPDNQEELSTLRL